MRPKQKRLWRALKGRNELLELERRRAAAIAGPNRGRTGGSQKGGKRKGKWKGKKK